MLHRSSAGIDSWMTTPEILRELAESAMLLSQGARRAIEMMREADEAAAREGGAVETTADAA